MVFGIVFNASHGMVPLVYLVGLVAMIFIATSYMAMARAFPIAGSVYAYAARSLGATAGFFAGWAILLDYLLIPSLAYVAAAIAMQAVFPSLSKPLCVTVMIAIATLVNYLGIDTTAKTSFALLAFQLVVLVIFAVYAWGAIAHHIGGAHFSLIPFYNPAEISPALIFGALSLAALSFLGFDAISTLSEESRGGAATIGRATMLSLVLSALLFMAQTWIAAMLVPGRTHFPEGSATDGAFYTVAAIAGGSGLKFLLAVPGVFLSSLAGGIAAQAATTRLLFGMARDGELPRVLAYVHPENKIPTRALLAASAITLCVSVGLANQFELLTSMVSFGALLGFLMLQVSVSVHFYWREKSGDWLRHLVMPAIGFAIVAYVLINAETNAKIAGLCWMIAGAGAFFILKKLDRPTELPA